MTWHMNDDVAVVWTSTALRANRYSCTLVWAEWVRAHGGWRKDGFGRELDPKNCTTGKSIPVCGLTELAGDFSVLRFWADLTIQPVTCRNSCSYTCIYMVHKIYMYMHIRDTAAPTPLSPGSLINLLYTRCQASTKLVKRISSKNCSTSSKFQVIFFFFALARRHPTPGPNRRL